MNAHVLPFNSAYLSVATWASCSVPCWQRHCRPTSFLLVSPTHLVVSTTHPPHPLVLFTFDLQKFSSDDQCLLPLTTCEHATHNSPTTSTFSKQCLYFLCVIENNLMSPRLTAVPGYITSSQWNLFWVCSNKHVSEAMKQSIRSWFLRCNV